MAADRYYYHELSVPHQIFYKKIFDAVLRYDEYIICGDKDYSDESIHKILYALILDMPELFYINTRFKKIENTNWGVIKIWPNYLYSKSDVEILKQEVEKRRILFLKDVNLDSNDQGEIIRKIHDCLISKTKVKMEVDENNTRNVTILGALLEGQANEIGLSLTFKYLLNQLDIKCDVLIDSYNGISRILNRVMLYGEYRYINLCEDAVRSVQDDIYYGCFGLTVEMLHKENHHPNSRNIHEDELSKDKCKEKTEERISEQEIKLDVISPKNIDTIDLDKLKLDDGINILNNLSAEDVPENLLISIENLVRKLESVEDLYKQYPNCNGMFDKYIMSYLPDLLRVLQEYFRYKKYSASPAMIDIVSERITTITKDFGNIIQCKLDIFWKEQVNKTVVNINEIQKNLDKDRIRKKKYPFNIDELEKEPDIETFIIAFEFFTDDELPKEWNEYINSILIRLNRLKKTFDTYESMEKEIERFLNYYLPEVLKLMILYDEYKNSGMDKNTLNDICKKIKSSLMTVNDALYTKLNKIYNDKAMHTKARAQALTDIIEQDGYIIDDHYNRE